MSTETSGMKTAAMKTPLGRVRGLGSARSGAHHWWHERLTSVASLILLVWFFISLLRLPDFQYQTLREWLGAPLAAVPMLLLIATLFWHLAAGLRVCVEDYVHEEGSKLFLIVAISFGSLLGAGLCLFAVAKLAFGGGG